MGGSVGVTSLRRKMEVENMWESNKVGQGVYQFSGGGQLEMLLHVCPLTPTFDMQLFMKEIVG